MRHEARPSKARAWVIVGIGLTIIAGLTVWGGATYDDHGNPLVDTSSAAVIVALITGIAAVLDRMLGRIRHQVENSHQTNMRDDLDDKHDELVNTLNRIGKDMSGMRRDIGRLGDTDHQVHQDLSQLRREFADHVTWSQKQADRIDDIEDTVDPRRK